MGPPKNDHMARVDGTVLQRAQSGWWEMSREAGRGREFVNCQGFSNFDGHAAGRARLGCSRDCHSSASRLTAAPCSERLRERETKGAKRTMQSANFPSSPLAAACASFQTSAHKSKSSHNMRRHGPALLLVLMTESAVSWTIPSSLAAAPVLASTWIANNPHHSTAVISSARGLIGDCVAQRMEGAKTFDARRTATYISWCNLIAEFYTRPWNCFLVERWLPAFVGEQLCWQNLMTSVAIDNFVLSPFVYCPLFYIFKDAAGGCLKFRNSLAQYRREFWPQMRLLWLIWIPANLVSFAFVPPYLRVAYNQLVGTLWVLALSFKTKLLATMGVACDETGCPAPDPISSSTDSWLKVTFLRNWVFVASFIVIQAATGAMIAVGLFWLVLLLWAGLS